MKRIIALIIFSLAWLTPLLSVQHLHQSDIQRVMNRLFSFHIENKELTTSIARRCFKLYIEQFDPEKSYLLNSEVLPYLQMGEQELAAVVERMSRQDYSDFFALNQTIQAAIERARELRVQAAQTLSLEAEALSQSAAPASRYAQSNDELVLRQKNRMVRFYHYHRARTDLTTAERRSKLFGLFERKVRRQENQYLYVLLDGGMMGQEEINHLFSLHVLKAFAKSLDTHTSFFSPEEAQEMRFSLEKQFEGVGVILSESIDGVMIAELVKGSPAEASGKIQINDLLVEIDGMSVEATPFDEVLELLKHRDKKEILLGFKRFDGMKSSFWRVELQRKPIVMNEERIRSSWEPYKDGVIGKISLYSFYESGDGLSSEREIKEAIKAFQNIGPLYGLVLDLRENSGGFLSQAVKVSGLFLANGVVVISKYGKGEVHYLRNIVGRSFFSGPLVVLTSKMSASAAEIVAQALQDYGVALVVGDERTFGKGSIQYQTVTDEKADLFFKVTVGKYYTASGRTTQIEGVKADIVVPTHYAPYNIGERYLEYPLSADRVEPAFVDPLTDLDEKAQRLFQRKYMPNLQRVVVFWNKYLPVLRANSEKRLAANLQFQLLLKKQVQVKARQKFSPPNSIDEAPSSLGADLQMNEAVHIVKDMILIERQAAPAAASSLPELQKTGTD